MRSLARHLAAAGIPAGLLFATYLLRLNLERLPAGAAALLPWLPWLVLVSALVLTLLFGRGRAFLVLLLVAALHWVLTQPLAWTLHGARLDAGAFRLGFAFLLPLNVAAIAWLRERGLLTRHGLLRLGLLGAQGLVLAVLAMSRPHLLHGWLDAMPSARALATDSALLTLPVLFAFALAAGLLLARYALTRGPFVPNLLGALVALFLVLRSAGDPTAGALFTATAALLVFVALLLDSYRMAYRDDLTGLPGRRALEEELLKLGSRYAIAMLDVDHFKKFNDRHGHDVGDQVLKLVAARMQQVRGGGRPFRYGGEEFTVLFPGRSTGEAVPHLEALREAIAGSSFQLRGKNRPQVERRKKPRKGTGRAGSVSVTVSIGVAERDTSHPDPADVIRKADRALYLAKGAGRNRVCA